MIEIGKKFPGGAVRYTELDGDIGLMVAGGGAGLLQHDMIVAAGGRPRTTATSARLPRQTSRRLYSTRSSPIRTLVAS